MGNTKLIMVNMDCYWCFIELSTNGNLSGYGILKYRTVRDLVVTDNEFTISIKSLSDQN